DEPDGNYWKGLTSFFRDQLLAEGYILEADLNLLQLANSPQQAMRHILAFYSNYHSSRWLHDEFVLRLNRPLNDAALARINESFADICAGGGFVQQLSGDPQGDEP